MSEIVPVTREEKLVDAIIDSEVIADNGVTRAEKYLEHIMKGTTATEEPVTRAEHYLSKIAGMDVQLEEPVTRVEIYLASIAGMDVGDLPEPVTRLEKLLREWAETAAGELKTVTGAIIAISDALRRPAIDYTTTITPVQDLHGYDKPWVGGAGKNKLDMDSVVVQSAYGLTVSKDADGFFNIVGTYTGTAPNPSYAITTKDSVPYDENMRFMLFDKNADAESCISQLRFTDSIGGIAVDSKAVMVNGQSYNMRFRVVECSRSETPTAWTPYSNICPISGHDSVNVTRTGINIWDGEWELGEINSGGGQNQLSEAYWRTKNYIPVKPETTYYCSLVGTSSLLRARYYDANKDYIGYADYNGTQLSTNSTFKTPTNCYYMRFAPAISITDHNVAINYPSTATAYTPYVGDTFTVDWTDEAGTVYGGSLDVTTGVLTVDRASVDMGTLDWAYYIEQSVAYFLTYIDGEKAKKSGANLLCSAYSSKPTTGTTGIADKQVAGSTTSSRVYVRDDSYTDAVLFKTAMNGVQLVYELATPITYQLTPTEITMLLGNNTVWADTGDSTLKYWAEV